MADVVVFCVAATVVLFVSFLTVMIQRAHARARRQTDYVRFTVRADTRQFVAGIKRARRAARRLGRRI